MSTLALPQLIARIVASGCFSEPESRSLVEVMTASIVAALQRNGSTTIPGIGTFRVVTLGTEPSIAFAPDSTIAAEINAPFAMFEPMELPDGVSELDIETDEIIPFPEEERESESDIKEMTVPANDSANSTDGVAKESNADAEIAATPEQDVTEPETIKLERKAVPPPIPESIKTSEIHKAEENRPETIRPAGNSPIQNLADTKAGTLPAPIEAATPPVEKIIEKERIVEVHSDSGRHTLNIILFSVLSLIAGLIIGYFMCTRLNIDHVKNVNIEAEGVKVFPASRPETIVTELPDSTSSAIKHSTEVDTLSAEIKPAKTISVELDTVRVNRYLTTMALEHYGKKKFWVYIYLENKATLSDPDHIAPNTVVVIPPAEKYGIKSGDKTSEADAEHQAELIYRDTRLE